MKTFTYFYKPSQCFNVENKENVTVTLGLRTITRNMTDLGKVHQKNHLRKFNFFDITKTKGPSIVKIRFNAWNF